MRIAIQGERGSFHHAAALKHYGSDIELLQCDSFADVFRALDGGAADALVVAIENSLYGSINEVYDLLLGYRFYIVGEIPERVHQCLIGFAGTDLKDITHVYSHPVALAQCSDYLRSELENAEKIEYTDTAGAVRLISENRDVHACAIASALSAQLYGLTVLADDIENHELNYTRFLAVEKNPKPVRGANKASLVLQTDHTPGALYRALGVFADRDINLTKLQSRPIPGAVWRYMFYVDLEATSAEIMDAIAALKLLGCEVAELGQYHAQSSR